MRKIIILLGLGAVLLCAGECLAQYYMKTEKAEKTEKPFCVLVSERYLVTGGSVGEKDGLRVWRCEDSDVLCYVFSARQVHCRFK